ncbi:hypothetical protein BAUCODRAFT_29352 [Baudoinia panamericana UAMH 10762]|uniref:SnoaL-like domain-containing protein n=1 Tax=Baudoinia panamericana (strain UAMH 10762) TaxID=717646 RepID=M2M1N9_BAUPA|nr:uncharacterized protein BAUCODRAFT_29352 [Baudoinia panamericana UAMH 10762]EMD00968.1 hypothetical protein BAUCODRAFT_29352 [Baudoinia panamericana UAMH 10762]
MWVKVALTASFLWPSTSAFTFSDNSSHACSGSITLPSNLTNTSLSALPQAFSSANQAQDAVALDQIRNTLALYPLCIDGKDFASLSLVFASDAVANYSAPLNILTPLSTIETVLAASLASVTTQHLLGTQDIQLVGPCAARSVTYYRAAHFGEGVYEGEMLYAYGQYRDVLVRLPEGWRVKERTLAYMVSLRWWMRSPLHSLKLMSTQGPLLGNASIFTPQA